MSAGRLGAPTSDSSVTGTTVDRYLRSVKAYGALGDGATPDQVATDDAGAGAPAVIFADDGDYVLAANRTFGATRALVFTPGARVSVSAGVTMTIVGPVLAGKHQQIFTGAGTVVLTRPDAIYPTWFGALGDNATDNAAAWAKADAVAVAAGVPLTVPSGTFILGSGTYASPLVFEPGAKVVRKAAATVTLSGLITAAPTQNIFDAGTLGDGGTFTVSAEQEVYANWWVGANIGVQWNTMRSCVPAAHRFFALAPGTYTTSTVINCTNFDGGGVRLRFSGATITSTAGPGYAGIEYTDTSGAFVYDLRLRGDATTSPDVGVILARENAVSPASAAKNQFFCCDIQGSFGKWALYSVTSESNVFIDATVTNSKTAGVGGAICIASTNIITYVGVHNSVLTPPNSTSSTNTAFVGITRATSSCASGVAFYVHGHDRVHATYLQCNNPPNNGRANVVMDCSTDSLSGTTIGSYYGEGRPVSDIEFAGSSTSRSIAQTSITVLRSACSGQTFLFGQCSIHDNILRIHTTPNDGGSGLAKYVTSHATTIVTGAEWTFRSKEDQGDIVQLGASFMGTIHRNTFTTLDFTTNSTVISGLIEVIAGKFGGIGVPTWTEVRIGSTNIKALRATPQTLVAAPGAGYALRFLDGFFILKPSAAALTEVDDNLAVRFGTAAGAKATEDIEATGFIGATADTMIFVQPAASVAIALADVENKALVLHNIGGDEYAGDAPNNARLYCRLLTVTYPTAAFA